MKHSFAGFLLFLLMLSTNPAAVQADGNVQLRSHLRNLEQQFQYEQQHYKQLQQQINTLLTSNRQQPQGKQSKQPNNCSQSSAEKMKSLGILRNQQKMKLHDLSQKMNGIRQQLQTANQPAQQ